MVTAQFWSLDTEVEKTFDKRFVRRRLQGCLPKSRNVWDSILKKGGADLLRLNTPTRPIENEYPERKLKSTLERE